MGHLILLIPAAIASLLLLANVAVPISRQRAYARANERNS